MSGIAAIYHFDDKPINDQLVHDITASMAIRGPDAQHYWSDKHIALSHTLLNIDDKHPSDQPENIDDKIWITANARIDGQSELIQKIRASGISINEHIEDQHLILLAYQIWGTRCVEHFIGDFSFVIWDKPEQKLFCAVDKLGVNPLYYAEIDNGICISNSINSIRFHPDISVQLNHEAIADYLSVRMSLDKNNTTFKQIKRLPAAHCLTVHNAKSKVEAYWKISDRYDIHQHKNEECVDEFNELFKSVLSDRLRSQHAGADLSGGMDSTSIVAISQEILSSQNKTLQTHTFGSTGSLEDLEGPLASKVAAQLGVKNHRHIPTKNRFIPDDTIALHLISPEPSLMRRDLPSYHSLQHTSQHSRTYLTGFGGDALLHSRPLNWQDINSPSKAIFIAKQAWLHKLTFGTRPPVGLRNRPLADFTLANWLQDDFAKETKISERVNEQRHIELPQNYQRRMNSDALWQRLFSWNDPGFTHIPIKVCHPFFDVRLIEFALRLPPFLWLHKKHILRQAMQSHLPKAITHRKKMAVQGEPLSSLIKEQGLHERSLELLHNEKLSPFINSDILMTALFSTNIKNQTLYRDTMKILTLSHWLTHYEKIPNAIKNNSKETKVKKITKN